MPGTRQNCSLDLLPKDNKPKAKSESVLSQNQSQCCLEPSLLCQAEVIRWQGAGWSAAPVPCPWLALFWSSSSSLSTCCWQFHARALPTEATVCCWELLLPCCLWKQFFTGARPDAFHKEWLSSSLCPGAWQWGAAGQRARRRGGELATVADGIWPREDVECLLQYAFSLLISSWAELIN